MPGLVRDCFEAAGAVLEDHLAIRPVDPMYRAVYEDGSVLHVRHGRDAMAAEIREVCGAGEAAAFGRFCDWLTDLYRIEMPNFIDRNFDSVLDLARPVGPALALVRAGGFGKLARAVARFFADPRLQRIFSFQAMYAGLAPYQALALYGVITYMDSVEGVHVPVGGMHALPVGLARAAEAAGVEFRLGTEVDRILLEHGTTGRVRGVRLVDGERIDADVVVCNADLPVAYRTLLGGLDAPRTARRGTYSPSCVVWHAGVVGSPPAGTAHHNIHFGRTWDAAFRDLLDRGVPMADPSFLVTIASLDDPELAPPGRSTIYALEPVPNLDGAVDWGAERDRIRDRLVSGVAACGYPVEVEVEAFVDPLDWEASGLERGAPFSLSHRFLQTGPFRPDNLDRRAPGLVFVGSATRPGVGVPMVLVSGRLAAARVDAYGRAGAFRRA
jgi:phytoene desaturase